MRTKLLLSALVGLGVLAAAGWLPPRPASAHDQAIRAFMEGGAPVSLARAAEGRLVAVGDFVLGAGAPADPSGMATAYVTGFLAVGPDIGAARACPTADDGWGVGGIC